LFGKQQRQKVKMTKTEKRVEIFKSGMKVLSEDSKDYIHKLTHILLLVEHPPVYPYGRIYKK